MAYTLPQLQYSYTSLEPHIDARTMEIHHTKHHQAYIDKVNAALEGTQWSDTSIEEVVANIDCIPEDKKTVVRNNGGGHANHTLFWSILSPNSTAQPTGDLARAIHQTFGSFDTLKEQFSTAAATRSGSGWTWLIVENKTLKVGTTANQDHPLMGNAIAGVSGIPILGLDVWEHAYYLQYQNRRLDYIAAFWNVVNWEAVNTHYSKALLS